MRNICFFNFFILALFFSFDLFALSPVEEGVYFKNIQHAQKLTSPFTIEMLVIGKKVAPAGDPTPGTGHHHLIINGPYFEEGQIIPADEKHIHYGQGETQAKVDLAPGKYTLTLQFADMNHISFGKDWARSIVVEVVD